MPLVGSSRRPDPVPEPEPEPNRRASLFRRRQPAVSASPPSKTIPAPRGRDSMSSTSSGSHHTPHRSRAGSLLSKLGRDSDTDPSILEAREHVMSAEAAESEADRALDAARKHVREAKDHVQRLEMEAHEQARKAKIKEQQAHEVSKRGRGLGRHG